jgi:hypothetical protein
VPQSQVSSKHSPSHLSHPPPMLSHTRILFRKLRGISSRGSRGSEPAPSAPATTAESETFNPRAIHISDVRRSPTKLPRKPGIKAQSVSIMVKNAKGASNSVDLYRVRIYLAQRTILQVPLSEYPLAELTPRGFISYSRERRMSASSTLQATTRQTTFATAISTV